MDIIQWVMVKYPTIKWFSRKLVVPAWRADKNGTIRLWKHKFSKFNSGVANAFEVGEKVQDAADQKMIDKR